MNYCFGLILLVFSVVSSSAFAQQAVDRSADEAAIRATVQALIDSRERSDRAAMTALFTDDADQIVTSGNLRAGRDAVVEASLSATLSSGARRSISMEKIRFLGADTAIGDGPYDVVDIADEPDRNYRTTIVFRRVDGMWKIAAIRNMQPRR